MSSLIEIGVRWYFEQLKRILLSEYLLWVIVGGLVSARFWVLYPSAQANIDVLIGTYYFDLLIGILLALFPFVFYQIFGNTPLQTIKDMRAGEPKQNIVISGAGNVIHMSQDDPASKKQNVKEQEMVTSSVQLLIQLTRSAELLANKIYTRSGVYLIFGVLIAFSGILYFSFQGLSISGELDNAHTLIMLVPKFGILFFIEFIAFFFLKQYRAAMDEFRHYDAIKRNRESQLAIFLMATNEFSEKDFHKVVEKINFFEPVGKLSVGETTEILELSKINKNELELLKELVTDLVKRGKTAA